MATLPRKLGEFIEGESVEDMVDRQGPFSPERACEIVLQVAEALARAHESGIVHGDIRPANILLTRDGKVKLAGLGVARPTGDELARAGATGVSIQMPFYTAPEQCRAPELADARSDIYSLGASWYRMVVGEVPFSADSASELIRKHVHEPLRWPAERRGRLPKGVVTTIGLMMSKEPDERIQTMRELVRVIRERCLGVPDAPKRAAVRHVEQDEPAWVIRVEQGGEVRKLRVAEHKLRKLIRAGVVSPHLPVRQLGEPGSYRPIGEVRALAADFRMRAPTPRRAESRNLAGEDRGKRSDERRERLRDLIANYGKIRRGSRRRKKLKKLADRALRVFVTVAVIGALAFVSYKYLTVFIKLYFGPGP